VVLVVGQGGDTVIIQINTPEMIDEGSGQFREREKLILDRKGLGTFVRVYSGELANCRPGTLHSGFFCCYEEMISRQEHKIWIWLNLALL
jgi:hypothetical protein